MNPPEALEQRLANYVILWEFSLDIQLVDQAVPVLGLRCCNNS